MKQDGKLILMNQEKLRANIDEVKGVKSFE